MTVTRKEAKELLKRLDKSGSEALASMYYRGDRGVVSILVSISGQQMEDLRIIAAALDALQMIGMPAVPALTAALEAKSARGRSSACNGLGTIFREFIRGDRHVESREQLIALAERVVRLLVERLKDTDELVQATAAQALGRIAQGGPLSWPNDLVDKLVEALKISRTVQNETAVSLSNLITASNVEVDLQKVRNALHEGFGRASKGKNEAETTELKRRMAHNYIIITRAVTNARKSKDMDGVMLEGAPKPPKEGMYRAGRTGRATIA